MQRQRFEIGKNLTLLIVIVLCLDLGGVKSVAQANEEDLVTQSGSPVEPPAESKIEEMIIVSPLIWEGTPMEVVTEDLALPTHRLLNQSIGKKKSAVSSSGAVTGQLRSRSLVPVTDSGQPGTHAQVRGVGRGASETQVQVFGLDMNPPLGGGFNFAVFPQYLWSDYQLRVGPSGGWSTAQGGLGGTLTLTPWTQEAIIESGPRWRLMNSYTTSGVTQVAGGVKVGDWGAVLMGWSDGKAQGPALSASTRWKLGRWTVRTNLLGSSVVADSPGTKTFPTPGDVAKMYRLIPHLQLDYEWSADRILKSALYFDQSYFRLESKEEVNRSQDRAFQWGVDEALIWGPWRFGARLKQAAVTFSGNEPPTEWTGGVYAGRVWALGNEWNLYPEIQLSGMSAVGLSPAASIGFDKMLRDSKSDPWRFYGRMGYRQKQPDLQSRFYPKNTAYKTMGNPDLLAESAEFAVTGIQKVTSNWDAGLEIQAQLRQNAQVWIKKKGSEYSWVDNQGSGVSAGGSQSAAWRALPWEFLGIELSHQFLLMASQLEETGKRYPGLPTLQEMIGVRVYEPGDQSRWEGALSGRFVSNSENGTGGQLAGYSVFDLSLTGWFPTTSGQGFGLTGKVENLFGRTYESSSDIEVTGPAFSVALVGEF